MDAVLTKVIEQVFSQMPHVRLHMEIPKDTVLDRQGTFDFDLVSLVSSDVPGNPSVLSSTLYKAIQLALGCQPQQVYFTVTEKEAGCLCVEVPLLSLCK